MTHIFNIPSDTFIRRRLRHNLPQAELALWKELRNKQILRTKFRRQYGISHFVVDFYCPQYKLAIEIDGDSHKRSKAKEYDRIRQSIIQKFGVTFLRFTNEEIYSTLEDVLRRIKAEIMKKSGTMPPPIQVKMVEVPPPTQVKMVEVPPPTPPLKGGE